MLRYLRENTGNWIIKIFLGIIVIVFVFLGVGSFGSKRNDSIATIDDKPITIKEYQQVYKSIVDQMRTRFGKNLNDDILKALNVKQQALDTLIEQKIILSEADKLKIKVSDKELQENLMSIKAFQRDGKFDLAQYKKVLSLNSLNPEIFEASQMNSLIQQKVRNLVLDSVNVSDLEARNWYIFQHTKTAVDYLAFTPGDYPDLKPDEDQIKQFYADNKDRYKSEPKIKAIYLSFSPEDYKDQVSVTQENIKEFYEQHIQEFKVPEKVEARHILFKLAEDADEDAVKAAEKKALDVYEMAAEGKDFEALARQYSEGPSKDNGGYLGTFEKESMVKPFADMAFTMKAGEISKPVRTMFGWHIIQVVARLEASTQSLAQASETIKKDLETQGMQNLAYDRAGEAFDAVVDGDDFEQVALIAKKKVLKTKAFDINGNGLDMAENIEFARTAFELSLDAISDVKQFGDNYYLINIVEKITPVVQDLAVVKDRITKELSLKLQKEAAEKQAQAMLSKAKVAPSLAQLAIEQKLTLKTTPLFARTGGVEGVGNSSDFIQAGFSLNETKRLYPEIVETSSGYYILGFKETKMPEEADILKNMKTMKAEISWKKQTQSFQAWMTELKKHYEIKYDPEMLK